MSGGAYQYAHRSVSLMADELHCDCPLRSAFRGHLRLVAEAMYALEMEDSGDGADWRPKVQRVVSPHAVLEQATRQAEMAFGNLTEALAQVREREQEANNA